MLEIYDFSVDHVTAPSLVRCEELCFGWKLRSDRTGVRQESYRLLIEGSAGAVFDSGTVVTEKSIDIYHEELVLAPRADYTLTLRVSDTLGETAVKRIRVSSALCDEDWQGACWIKPAELIPEWSPFLRTSFCAKGVKRAVLYACGLGYAEYYVNGQRADDFFIDPPFSNYTEELYYRRIDVTSLLQDGENALVAWLGNGFWGQGRTLPGSRGNRRPYGDPCLKLKLFLDLADGTTKEIATNTADWKCRYSPITSNNVYAGEVYDARIETPDFSLPGISVLGWGDVTEDKTEKGRMLPSLIPPVRVLRELPAVSVTPCSGTSDSAWLFDVGENIAGVPEFHLPPSPSGALYTFRYAEVLNEGGTPDYRSTGGYATQCIQQDIYICRGDPDGEVYRPRFTYHGFRYVEMTGFYDVSNGYGTQPTAEICKALQLTTDFAKSATFSCSDDYLNRLYRVMDNTYRSNFHGFPEDCPVRERCGWLGDAQVLINWGLLSYDSLACYEKYMQDIRSSVDALGYFPNIAPGKRSFGKAAPLWGCAQIVIPYYMYKYCGDTRTVRKHFDLMRRFYEEERAGAKDHLHFDREDRTTYGDWNPPCGLESERRMPTVHSSTMIFYEISLMMAELCDRLGLDNPDYYLKLAQKTKLAFIERFYDKECHSYGYWGTDGIALKLGLYPEGEEKLLLAALTERIERDGYDMPTGIYANKYLLPALLEQGCGEIAYRVLFNKNTDNFARLLDEGGTTLYEELDMRITMPREKRVGSYNHPMHGGFLYMCYTHLAGIVPSKPGFAEFELSPCHIKEIRELSASLDTAMGKIALSFACTERGWRYRLSVPANTACRMRLDFADTLLVNEAPCANLSVLPSGEYDIEAIYSDVF